MDSTKKLTQAGLLSSLFIVSTIIAVGSGFGYALYLDFAVPVLFCIIYIICGLKYSVLSAISSIIIIGLVLGNIGTAIWVSQSIFLGIMCGVLICRNNPIINDLVYGAIIGVFIMVFIDIYASKLIGYSFMKEFENYSKLFPYKEYVDNIYYLFIALFPFGTVFSIYYLSLILSKKLNILKGSSKNKLNIIMNFKTLSRYLCCSTYVFYGCVMYIVIVDLLNVLNIDIASAYLKTILISTQYLCMYFVIRDGYTVLQNYLMTKFKSILYIRIVSIMTVLLLVFFFKITLLIIVAINIMLDKKINIRTKQISIVNNYINKL